MQTTKPSLRIAAVAFPFVALLAWTISVQVKHNRGDTIRLKIVGYDPVDLLSGHYLRFRYDLGSLDLCREVPNKMSVCACLKPADKGTMEAETVGDCTLIQTKCSTMIRGNCQYNTFLTFSERYFFPEEYSSVLALVPPESQAEVRLDNQGNVSLHKIFVGGQDILDYAKDRLRFPAKP